MRAYLFDRCLLVQAQTLVVDRRTRPYRRLAATIIIANRGDVLLEAGDKPPARYEGVLVAPNVARRFIEAVDCDLTIIDAGITSTAYRALAPRLARNSIQRIDAEALARAREVCRQSFGGEVACSAAIDLFHRVVAAVAGDAPPAPEYDARVRRVLELCEERRLDELAVSALAAEVGLSESRLRALFAKQIGCTLPQVRRWIAVWKAAMLWREDLSFTDVAHIVGFYDLAHADHVLAETFGISPSDMIDRSKLQFHRC
ncbi:MAG TPA: AraC family transcriptional regulator [Candidatus Limnocylindrales bacterium]|nr:AraC family transcriptional regulator [Candidatus Limnocylindrales bacterium]